MGFAYHEADATVSLLLPVEPREHLLGTNCGAKWGEAPRGGMVVQACPRVQRCLTSLDRTPSWIIVGHCERVCGLVAQPDNASADRVLEDRVRADFLLLCRVVCSLHANSE